MANYNKSTEMAIQYTNNFFRERMEDLTISQYRLSKMTGIPESTLSRSMTGKTEMSLSTYFKICGALELRPYLIPAEDDTNKMIHHYFN